MKIELIREEEKMKRDSSIIGVIYPLPEHIASFMFKNKRDIFVKYLAHPHSKKSKIKLANGMKLYVYQSKSDKLIVGEAVIKNIEYIDAKDILKKYKTRLMCSEEELMKYSMNRTDKKALVLVLKNLKQYQHTKRVSKPLTMSGLYLTKENKYQVLFK